VQANQGRWGQCEVHAILGDRSRLLDAGVLGRGSFHVDAGAASWINVRQFALDPGDGQTGVDGAVTLMMAEQ
jgi:hypothetical protein